MFVVLACEMISAMLSNLFWASSIMASCFLFPNPPKAVPTGRPALVENAGIEAPPAITAEVIKPASTIPIIVFNHFFSFASRLLASTSVNFFNQYACDSWGAEGFKSG